MQHSDPASSQGGQAIRRTRVLLLTSFGSIAVLLVAVQIIEYFQWSDLRRSVDLIDKDALASIRLVGRMGMDLQGERILLDRHILEHDPVLMTSIEARIATARDDYARAAREYAPLAAFEGEAQRWHQLEDDVAASELQISAALQLSQHNQDLDANQLVIAAQPTFDAISRDLAALIEINELAATRAQHRVGELELRVLAIRLALAGIIILVTFGVGLRATRTISRTEDQLRQQALELENANRELDAFAGRVAHDLRGPLNTISLASSMLAERVPEETATTSIMRRGIAQMTSLVKDLLDLSRIGTAAVGAGASTEALAAVLAKDLGALVHGAGGTLRIDLAPATLHCSEGLLREALWNLGENAVKYRRPDVPAAVELVGRAEPGRYEIRVSDNGRGMSRDDARHAFDPFFRGEPTSAIPGTGLGLAIVRRIVEASGGKVSIDSELGRGTSFVLELPFAQAEATVRMPCRRAGTPPSRSRAATRARSS